MKQTTQKTKTKTPTHTSSAERHVRTGRESRWHWERDRERGAQRKREHGESLIDPPTLGWQRRPARGSGIFFPSRPPPPQPAGPARCLASHRLIRPRLIPSRPLRLKPPPQPAASVWKQHASAGWGSTGRGVLLSFRSCLWEIHPGCIYLISNQISSIPLHRSGFLISIPKTNSDIVHYCLDSSLIINGKMRD